MKEIQSIDEGKKGGEFLSSNTSVFLLVASYFFLVFDNNAQLTLCLTDHLSSSLSYSLSSMSSRKQREK